MRLAALLLEFRIRLAGLTLLVEDDLIECVERARRGHLRSDIAGLETCAERQDLRAAIGRCSESETGELCDLLDQEFTRQQFDRRFSHSHLRNS